LRFLKKARKWLADDGILVFIVPQYILKYTEVASYLAGWFWNIAVLKFPSQFEQVVVIGKGKGSKYVYPSDQKRIQEIGDGNSFSVVDSDDYYYPSFPFYHNLNDAAEKYLRHFYKVETQATGPELFVPANIRPEDILEWLEGMALSRKVLDTLQITENKNNFRPLMTLRKGHLVQVLVAGGLNGKITDKSQNEILLKGGIRKEVIQEEHENKVIYKEKFKLHLKYFDASGVLKEVTL